MKTPKLITFWKYHGGFGNNCNFCYGTVTKFREDGYVEAEEYPGFKFKPVKILPEESAGKLKQQLINIEGRHNDLDKKLNKTKSQEWENLIKEFDL
jgi:hypothetical protein